MRSYSALLAAFLIVLLAAPAAPAVAGTGTPAAPAADPPTFNVRRLAVYPGDNNQYVAAWGDQAFLSDGTHVDLYDISDLENPEYLDRITAIPGFAAVDIDARNGRMAGLARDAGHETVLQVFDVSAGTFATRCNVHFDWGEWNFPERVRLSISGSYAYVGFQSGLAVVYLDQPVDNECQFKGTYIESDHLDDQYVDDIVQIVDPTYGDKLYLAEKHSVTVLSLTDPAHPTFLTSYPMSDGVGSVAVASNGAIFAATGWNSGLTIIYQGDTRAYLPGNRAKVVADGNTVYMGTETDTDLKVIEASRLTLPLSQFLPVYGRYTDSYAYFYSHRMVVNKGLVHSPAGIFEYRTDLLLQAVSAGVTKDGTVVPPGATIVANPGDQISLEAASAAQLKVRCSANSMPKPEVDVRQVVNRIAPEFPTAVIDVVLDPTLLGFWATEECKKQTSLTRLLTDPPALPLSLVSGGIQMQVPATAGAVAVDTTYAGSRAAGGTTFQAGHNPTAGVSQFVCLVGMLQVQPTAAGAPLLNLGPGEYVNITAAGAGPVGQYRYVYLPLLRR